MAVSESNSAPNTNTEVVTMDHLWPLFPGIAGFLCGRGLSAEEAEDLAQETLMAAFEQRGDFRGAARLSTWVFGIAKKKWLQWRRDQRRLKRDGVEVGVGEHPAEDATVVTLEASDPGPEERLLARERYRAICEAIPALPHEMSSALILHVQEGHSYKEIACLLRSNVNHISSLIYQARQKLRRVDSKAMIDRELIHD